MGASVNRDDPTLADLAALPIWAARGAPERVTKERRAPINPRSGGFASITDPTTWAVRAAAEECAARFPEKRQPGVGIMLGTEHAPKGLTRAGVDMDGCRDPESGEIASWAAAVVMQFGTYAEVSPSGTGLHLIFYARVADVEALRAAKILKHGRQFSRGEHVEISPFFGAKFLTVTDEVHGDEVMDYARLRTVERDTLEWLLNDYGPAFAAAGSRSGTAGQRDESGSGYGFRADMAHMRRGLDDDQVAEAMEADEAQAGEWWSRADDRQRRRTIDRARKEVGPVGSNRAVPDFDPDGDATHDGLIKAFEKNHAGELLFDHDRGGWFRFDGVRWCPQRTKLALHYAREVSIGMAEQDPKAKQLRTVPTWEAVERGARTVRDFAADSSWWNTDPWLLGTPGGTVELRSGQLRPADPADYISRITAAAPVPLDSFEPKRDCPQWLAFLDHALAHDAAAIRFLQQWAGYSLTGDTREQVLLFIYGEGGSGKGTAINTIAAILGDYAIGVATSTLTAKKYDAHAEEIARLHGPRMAIASETEKGSRWAENRIKSMTGQDRLTARYMRENSFDFTPQFKLTIFGNNAPSLSDVDSAIRRRFMILPFTQKPAKADTELGDKLRAEWPGILTWMIRGCLDWQANGIVRPSIVQAATEDYFAAQDVFAQWLDEKCEVAPGLAATTDQLFESWSFFARVAGEEPGTRNKTFPERLQQRGFESIRDRAGIRGRGFAGLRLLPRTVSEFDDLV
jgi:putative DNA primase/helicase